MFDVNSEQRKKDRKYRKVFKEKVEEAKYWKAKCMAKREVTKKKRKVYSELFVRLETEEGEQGLYQMARQRN